MRRGETRVRRTPRALRALAAAALAGAAGAVAAATSFVLTPLPRALIEYGGVASLRILDREGGLLREVRSRADGRSVPLGPGDVSAPVRAAFLAAEDSGFERHVGISPSAVVRAAWQNLRAGRVVAGGSTITQQLARLLVPRPRTLLGKAQEALWALRLEAHLSKRELLAQYLNRASFGNGAVGLEAAAQLYFGTSARLLSLGQAAALAALVRGPTAYDPLRAPERFELRRQWILGRLSKTGLWPAGEVERARAEPVDLTPARSAFRAPHAVQAVLARAGPLGLERAASLHTTLDPSLQASVEAAVAEEVGRLAERRVGSAAALVIDNATGDVLAYVGSADFFSRTAEGQNDGVQMRRQPGSALKPFLYAVAFERGFTPATVLADVPTAFAAARGAYAPQNYDRRAHGPVRAREALASSFNVPAVRLASALGVEPLLTALRAAGFESLDAGAEHYGLGLALGNGEVSLWEAARAYAGLARGGVAAPLRLVRAAADAEGRVLSPLPELSPRRFVDARAAALVTHVLADNAARARTFGLDSALRLPFPVAVKTGTSKGFSDNWTVGYTRERTVAVWAGNFDGRPMLQVSGVSGAGPIFARAMTAAMKGLAPRTLVDLDGLSWARICPLSGELHGAHCPAATQELFFAERLPSRRCGMHGALADGLPPRLRSRCRALAAEEGGLADLGVDFYDWARNEGLSREPWLAPVCLDTSEREPSGAASSEVRILHPAPGDEFLLLADLPLADQAIPLRVRASAATGPLDVLLDGARLARLDPPYTGRLPATRGAHTVSLHSRGGAVLASVRYVVRAEPRL